MKDFNKLMIGALFISPLMLSQSVSAVETEATPDPSRTTGAIVNFIPNDGPVRPVDPLNPGNDVTPKNPDGTPLEGGTAGPLSLDFASVLSFDRRKISTKDEVYNARAQTYHDSTVWPPILSAPIYVQVTDNRGTLKGWTLSVKQNGQFKSVTTETILTGAEIRFHYGQTASISESLAPTGIGTFSLNPDGLGIVENIMKAEEGQGGGTWVYRFGDESSLSDDPREPVIMETSGVTLSVPGGTNKMAEQYKTSLTWTLSSLPGNE